MQRGYRAVSISDIVGAAEITKPTLYYHFSDKEDLFVQMVLHVLQELHTHMAQVFVPLTDTRSKLIALIQMMLDSPNSDLRVIRQEAREQLSARQQARVGYAFQEHMFIPLRDLMAEGLERSELTGHSADELAMLFLGFLEGFHYQNEQHSFTEPQFPRPAFTTITFSPTTLVRIFLHGVGT
jgi:AcrR family transcriptional regulator